MKPLRWTMHAVKASADRKIDPFAVEPTIAQPELDVPDPPNRRTFSRHHDDPLMKQRVMLHVVIEESEYEWSVITLYKTPLPGGDSGRVSEEGSAAS